MKTHVGTIQSWRTGFVLCSTAILFAAPGTNADAAGQSMQAQMKAGPTPKTDAPTPPPAGVAGGAVGMAAPPEAAARETVSDMFNSSGTADNVLVGRAVHEARQADAAANEAARAAMRADSSAAGAAAAAARTKAERRATDKATERTNVKER